MRAPNLPKELEAFKLRTEHSLQKTAVTVQAHLKLSSASLRLGDRTEVRTYKRKKSAVLHLRKMMDSERTSMRQRFDLVRGNIISI